MKLIHIFSLFSYSCSSCFSMCILSIAQFRAKLLKNADLNFIFVQNWFRVDTKLMRNFMQKEVLQKRETFAQENLLFRGTPSTVVNLFRHYFQYFKFGWSYWIYLIQFDFKAAQNKAEGQKNWWLPTNSDFLILTSKTFDIISQTMRCELYWVLIDQIIKVKNVDCFHHQVAKIQRLVFSFLPLNKSWFFIVQGSI